MTKRQSNIPTFNLTEQMLAVETEFHNLLGQLTFKKEHQLQTYSPLDAVQGFQFKGLQQVAEPTRNEMLENETGMHKLLANMLAHCRPGLLSQEDVDQLSGINGREMVLE